MVEEYETTRFRLREIRDSDIPALHANFSDRLMMKFYDLPVLETRDEIIELLARWRRREAEGRGLRWAIALQGSDRLIGTCGLQDINRMAGTAEVGCEINRRYWGRHVMHEVVPSIGRHAFEVLELDSLQAYIAPANRPSIALVQDCGFRRRLLVRDRSQVKTRRVKPQLFVLRRRDYLRLAHPDRVTPAPWREAALRFTEALGMLRPRLR